MAVQSAAVWNFGELVPDTMTMLTPLTIVNATPWAEERDPFGAGPDWSARGGGGSASGSSLTFTETSTSAPMVNTTEAFVRLDRRVRWHNAVLQDVGPRGGPTQGTTSTGEQLILERRGVISRYFAVSVSGANPASTPTQPLPREVFARGAVFVATIDDTSGDGVLSADDARVVIVTDQSGLNPRIVTPSDRQVLGLKVASQTTIVLLSLRADTNGDKVFDERDGRELWMIDLLDSPRVARPMISDATRERAESLVR
jgi:hypothetical protein